MKVFGRLLVVSCWLGSAAAMAAGPDWNALGKRWWVHVQFLADDKWKGRDTGSAGFEMGPVRPRSNSKARIEAGGREGYAQRR